MAFLDLISTWPFFVFRFSSLNRRLRKSRQHRYLPTDVAAQRGADMMDPSASGGAASPASPRQHGEFASDGRGGE